MLLTSLFNTILQALFPVSKAETEVLSYGTDQAYRLLPHAPQAPLSDASAVFAYKNELVTQLVWSIKYKRSPRGLAIGAYALHERLKESLTTIPTDSVTLPIILIPIPSSAKRLKERGFNQCELLLREIEEIDADKKFVVISDLLIRSKHISRQTLKNRTERLENTRGIFTVQEKSLQKMNLKSTVIIIDDVITTGSTMATAMGTLKEAGFEKVYGLALAH